MSDEVFRFERPTLARQICEAIASPIKPSAELFLAAARRTGKTYFLLNDLYPEAHARGWYVLYVDLWRSSGEGTLLAIKQVIQSALRDNESRLRQFLSEHEAKITIGKLLTLDLGRAGQDSVDHTSVSIADMLDTLQQVTGAPILLILDEAQQSLTDVDGPTAMAELKAARESMNRAGAEKNLMMLFTGSHRDKLSRLVSTQKMPFYGQTVGEFPMLGEDFSQALAEFVNGRLGEAYSGSAVEQAMTIVGRQPVAVWHAIDRISWPEIGQTTARREGEALNEALIRVATEIRDQSLEELEARIQDLVPAARALLYRIIDASGHLAPFHEDTRASLAQEIGQAKPLSNNQVQSAIQTLRDTDLVWSPKRGVYLLEDEGRIRAWAARNRGQH